MEAKDREVAEAKRQLREKEEQVQEMSRQLTTAQAREKETQHRLIEQKMENEKVIKHARLYFSSVYCVTRSVYGCRTQR